jgi:hypothetical protein
MFADPVIGHQLEEERTVKTTRSTVVDILDAGLKAHSRSFDPRVKTLLLPRRDLILEYEAEPFGVLQRADIG